MSRDLGERVYLVTGGAGAIGRGIGEAVLQEGGRVALLDLSADTAHEAAADLGSPSDVIGLQCDVCDAAAVEQTVAAVLSHFDRLDGAVNNAGIIQMNSAWELSAADWQKHFEVNVTGAFNVAHAVARHLRDQDGGAIVNVASNCGKVGYPNMAPYNASKAALINMTRSLATEWAGAAINVNAICPGGVDTPMLSSVAEWLAPRLDATPDALLAEMGAAQLGRRIAPREVGRVVAFLLSDDALIIRGQAINVDGGDTPY